MNGCWPYWERRTRNSINQIEVAIVLVLDRAGWHTSVRLRVPEHVHLLFLPPLFARTPTGRTPVAADQFGLGQPPLCHH